MRNIVSPLDGFASPFGRRFGAVIDPFAALMSNLLSGAAQVIAHPLEYGSMFQDRAGTTPVTEPGQLVGLALDHGFTGSKPVLGPELVTNGTFDDGLTGWEKNNYIISGGGASSVSGATNPALSQTVSGLTEGNIYEVRYTASVDIGSVGLFPNLGTIGNPTVLSKTIGNTAPKEYRFIYVAGPTGILKFTNSTTVSVLTIDNVSVRELPGYHATAISNAARGVFREVDGIRYIEYNGVNTAYSTPALAAPLVDKAQVFAGVRKLSDASAAALLNFAAGSDGSVEILAPLNSVSTYRLGSQGTIERTVAATGLPAPTTNVLTGLGDISGDLVALRVDGTQVAQSTADQGTGNYNPAGTYPLYYGARAGTSLFFNGRSYATLGPITRFSAANATTAQIEAAEAYYTARVI